jgi:DNA-binding Xre family transcriptional regulator
MTPPTKLERFLVEHGIKPAELARAAGCRREHLVRLRMGRIKSPRGVTRQVIVAACRRLSHTEVTEEELFD